MNRFPGLDLLRAMAIVWVMFFHSSIVGGLGPRFQWLSRFGWAGVDIFFVLSGFLIGSQVLRVLQRGERLALGEFYQRRAWRILPAFAVVLSAYLWFPALRESPGLEAWWQFASFTLNALIDYTHNQAFSHAWSLCVEENFYLVFPLLALWLTRRSTAAKTLSVFAGLMLFGIILRGSVWIHDTAVQPPRNWFIEDIYFPTWTRLDGLLMGVGLATIRVYRPQTWARLHSRSNTWLLAGAAVSGLALLLFRERTGLPANTIGWPLLSFGFGLLVLAGADNRSLIGRRPVPGMAWIASISYSLYLSHKMVFHIVRVTLVPLLPQAAALQFTIYALAALLVGAVLHYTIERPFLRWRDRRGIGSRLSENAAAA